jgi:hypothetical protein
MNTRFYLGLLIVASLAALCFLPPVKGGTLTSQVQIAVVSDFAETLGLSTPRDRVNYALTKSFANGTGTAQVNAIYHAKRTLASGASEELKLTGTLQDTFGNVVSFARVNALMIENTSASMTLTIGGSEANAWNTWTTGATDSVVIGSSGAMLTVNPLTGWVVASGTGDLLKITNSAGTATDYYIWIVGKNQ